MKRVFLFCILLFIFLALFLVVRSTRQKTILPESLTIDTTLPGQATEISDTTGLGLSFADRMTVSVFAKDLGGPRVLAFDPDGTLLVSLPARGEIVALPDDNADGAADRVIVVASGLNRPHGMAFRQSTLYVGETNQVAVFDYDEKIKKASNKKKVIDLPAGGNHVTRTIGFGPDGRLYISVGSSCNVCEEKDSRRAKILVAEVGSGQKGSGSRDFQGLTPTIFAAGLRNSVFFTWHPKTREMWATDMGRDLIGDNIPPEEVNIVKQDGNYGWPYCWGNRVHDDDFDPSGTFVDFCKTTEPPHIAFQAHSAPLGLAFIPDSWPAEYRGDLLVSFHGSWNRTEPTGYKVARFDLDQNGKSLGESDFISGWLPAGGSAGDVTGRPVDLLFDAQGTLFISDDKAGSVYRVSQR